MKNVFIFLKKYQKDDKIDQLIYLQKSLNIFKLWYFFFPQNIIKLICIIFKNSLASSKSRISIQFPSEMFSSSTKGLKYHRAAVCSPRYDISRIRILDKRCIVINTTLLHIHHAFRDRIPNLRIGIQNATYSILAAIRIVVSSSR